MALDCQGCHHGNNATARQCARCHTAAEIGATRQLPARMALTVWPQPRTRDLPFAHERHAGVACAECHADTRARSVTRDCASCHGEHHTAERTCASCHPPARATHQRELHATGCGAAGCHERERGAAVSPVRATCLACHAEQRDHKTNRECAACHLSDWAARGVRGNGASRGSPR